MKITTFFAVASDNNPDGDLKERINKILEANLDLKFISATFAGKSSLGNEFVLFFEKYDLV